MLRLEGILPPMVTPLLEGERVDEAGLARQVERMIAGGVHGIYLLGSTGESTSLRMEERRRAVAAAVATVKGRVPIVVGCMASSTVGAIEKIESAEAAGADAVAVTPPHYYPSNGEAELFAHYEAARTATKLPLVVYNIPGTTKVNMSAAFVARLAERDRVVAIKDSSGDWNLGLSLLLLLRDHPTFSILFGSLQVAGPAILYGAEGAVPGQANLDPAACVRLYDAARAGDVASVYAAQEHLMSLSKALTLGGHIACYKTALDLMGVCGPTATLPFQPIGDDGRAKIAGILREHGLL